MIELVMLVPSRGRPHNVKEMLAACGGLTTTKTRVCVIADDDDPALSGYQQLALEGYLPYVELKVVSEPRKIGPILNAVAPAYAQRYPFIGFMGDDHRPRTKGWDATLMAALRDRPGVAYGDDGHQGPNLPTACVISSGLIRALGYMAPPGCQHLYLDNFWKLLGQAAGNLAYRGDVSIEHAHAAFGKAAWDEGYTYSMSPDTMNADREAFEAWYRNQWLPADRAKLEAALGAFDGAPGHG